MTVDYKSNNAGKDQPTIINMGTAQGWPAPRNIPHSEQYGNTYWIGTCYERADAALEWEIQDMKDMPYLKHVKMLSKSWKTLRHLADFMEVGTSPLQWKYLKTNPDERGERCERTNITLLEYRSESVPKTTSITSANELKDKLEFISNERSEPPPLRMFIVEDLSRAVIEQLGSRFDIDPLFFREQIEDYVWHNTRDPWATPPSLTASTKQRSWFRLRNLRLRYHDTGTSFQNAKREANMWNVLRRPDNDNNHWPHKDAVNNGEEDVVSLTRTRTTIWIGQDKKCSNGTVGIVLLDPTLTDGKPLWYDRMNWLPTTSMEQGPPPALDLSQSWYKDIVQMTTAFPWSESAAGHTVESQVLTFPTIYTVCAEWLIVCDYVKTRLNQIEWEVELPTVFRSKGDTIDGSLKRLHTWRRYIPIFREMVSETLEQALPVAVRLTTASSTQIPPLEAFDSIKPDFERILKILEELQARIDRLTDLVTSEISIEDSKFNYVHNSILGRLTWLATIFVPLSFVSAFFSMNEDVSALKNTYGWFFLTAIPFATCVILFAYLAANDFFHLPMLKRMRTKTVKLS
ncbi:uncharacterized protein EKO05_0008125 [Ascochyta rabiei]|uniref:uncharacterized protein n=1 Tax=Didymella rabiei TaxID=5454 RepID=UPI0021FE7D3D|nr:uncharacterized protein EKO05_0008125 [Ascochyta rabiei]UPX17787.1 hypothetical protein EKO05_0008125 [Ascochyta rabiei]